MKKDRSVYQYNINNHLMRRYKKSFPSANVYTKPFAYSKIAKIIDETRKEYPKIETDIEFYEHNIYQSNWIDVEGMGYGWIWFKEPKNNWRKLISEYTCNWLSDVKKGFKTIFIEDEDFIIIHVPSRTLESKADIIITLGKESCREDIFF